MSNFSFSDLNLGDVKTAVGGGMLPPGRYQCEVISAIWKNTKAGGKMIELELRDEGGFGKIRTWINVQIPSSQEATRIGREQLKALCVHGGHPDPDNVGSHGIASLVGLKPGVGVASEDYVKNNEKRIGSLVKYFFDPLDLAGGVTPSASPSNGLNDPDEDIPF